MKNDSITMLISDLYEESAGYEKEITELTEQIGLTVDLMSRYTENLLIVDKLIADYKIKRKHRESLRVRVITITMAIRMAKKYEDLI